METIADRLKTAREKLEQAASDVNRPPNCVELLAVSKTKPVSDIVLAYEAGQRKFGENYVQEGVDKIQTLKELDDIEWHFIGPLQSNKTKLVAEHFDWMHTLSRTKIADRLNNQRGHYAPALNVCIQVNIDDEESKSGVSPSEVMALAEHISQLPKLKLRGLMAIPQATDDSHQQHQAFSAMQALFHDLQSTYPDVDTLSMGMTNDLSVAIANGSTVVRLGTAIFGARAPVNKE